MKLISRSGILTGVLCSALIATIGFAALPTPADAVPLAIAKAGFVKPESLVEKARVTIHVHPRRHYRHRRHHRCWWHRGRRVCGWR
jgi:hypothetical protein